VQLDYRAVFGIRAQVGKQCDQYKAVRKFTLQGQCVAVEPYLFFCSCGPAHCGQMLQARFYHTVLAELRPSQSAMLLPN